MSLPGLALDWPLLEFIGQSSCQSGAKTCWLPWIRKPILYWALVWPEALVWALVKDVGFLATDTDWRIFLFPLLIVSASRVCGPGETNILFPYHSLVTKL